MCSHARLAGNSHVMQPDSPLAGRFHLGQPVALGPPEDTESTVLRVALGARLVNDLAATPDSGASWLREPLLELRTKAEYLIDEGMV